MIKTQKYLSLKKKNLKTKESKQIVGNKQDKENKEAALHFEDYTSNKNKL